MIIKEKYENFKKSIFRFIFVDSLIGIFDDILLKTKSYDNSWYTLYEKYKC